MSQLFLEYVLHHNVMLFIFRKLFDDCWSK